MESQIISAIIASTGTFLLTLGGYFLYKRKYKAEVRKIESDSSKQETEIILSEFDIIEKAREAVRETYTQQRALDKERNEHQRDNDNNDLLIRIKDEKINDQRQELDELREKIYDLSRGLGELRGIESKCQEDLAELKLFRDQQGHINQKLEEYSDRTVQLTALLKKAKSRGYVTDEEMSLIKK